MIYYASIQGKFGVLLCKRAVIMDKSDDLPAPEGPIIDRNYPLLILPLQLVSRCLPPLG